MNRIYVITVGLCLILNSSFQLCAQESDPPKGFDWLKQFEGKWAAVSKTPGTEQVVGRGTMESKVLGKFWIENTHQAKMPMAKFTAIQTIGYNNKKERYTGNWIDSLTDYKWEYDGEVDESGKKIILNAEGPDWTDPSKMKDYRDIYEFKSPHEIVALSQIKNDDGEWETFMEGLLTRLEKEASKKVTPFLMFEGRAEEAIDYYKTVFDDLKILEMNKYKEGEAGKEGSIQVAEISIGDQRVKMIDSYIKHGFTFTPSFSFFVECESENQLKSRVEKLAEGGKVMMPVGEYGFSKKFAWVSDKFGVSWQLNLN